MVSRSTPVYTESTVETHFVRSKSLKDISYILFLSFMISMIIVVGYNHPEYREILPFRTSLSID